MVNTDTNTGVLTPFHAGEYADLYIMPDHALRIQLTEAGKAELRERSSICDAAKDDQELRFDCTLSDILEDILCNSDIEILNEASGDYNAIGALTSAPIIVDGVNRNNDGKLLDVGRTWWFPDYAIRNEMADLVIQGFVDFQSAD